MNAFPQLEFYQILLSVKYLVYKIYLFLEYLQIETLTIFSNFCAISFMTRQTKEVFCQEFTRRIWHQQQQNYKFPINVHNYRLPIPYTTKQLI